MKQYDVRYADKDFEAKYLKMRKIRNLAIAGIPLGFVCFGGGVPIVITTDMLFLLFIPLLGFACIPTSIVTMGILTQKLYNMRQTHDAIELIKSQDKVFIFQLAGGAATLELQVLCFVQKLIANGVLEGYTVIGNVAVVKTSLGCSEKEIMREYALLRFGKTDKEEDDYANVGSLSDYADKSFAEGETPAEEKECYYCHAKVPNDAMYCPKCGTRLDF